MFNNLIRLRSKSREEKGFTFIEYALGLVVISSIVYVGMNTMGTNFADLFRAIGRWTVERAGDLNSGN